MFDDLNYRVEKFGVVFLQIIAGRGLRDRLHRTDLFLYQYAYADRPIQNVNDPKDNNG